MLNLPVPASLILPQKEGEYGNVSRVGHQQGISLHTWSILRGDDSWKAEASEAYPLEVIAFDLWVGNVDRHINYGNLLVVDAPGDGIQLVPLDYDLSLGSKRRWDENRFESPGCEEELPYLQFMVGKIRAKDRVLDAAERIAELDSSMINTIIARAADYCDRELERKLAESTQQALLYRQGRLCEWIEAVI